MISGHIAVKKNSLALCLSEFQDKAFFSALHVRWRTYSLKLCSTGETKNKYHANKNQSFFFLLPSWWKFGRPDVTVTVPFMALVWRNECFHVVWGALLVPCNHHETEQRSSCCGEQWSRSARPRLGLRQGAGRITPRVEQLRWWGSRLRSVSAPTAAWVTTTIELDLKSMLITPGSLSEVSYCLMDTLDGRHIFLCLILNLVHVLKKINILAKDLKSNASS